MNHLSPSDYTDFQGLSALKLQAKNGRGEAVREVAKQFESLFIHMMVKQMRQTSLAEGILDNKQVQHYQEMYDHQLALHLANGRGLGLAEVMRAQLGGGTDETPKLNTSLGRYFANPTPVCVRPSQSNTTAPANTKEIEAVSEPAQAISNPDEFVTELWPAAERAAAKLGLPPEALLAQAALETGWGRHVMPATDGQSSHNLFGIKADQRWDGSVVRRETLEYEEDIPVRRRDAFRAYGSYQDSFEDYVAFIQSSPRYTEALENTDDCAAYFNSLQQSGYATDPKYAEKIMRVMGGDEMQAALSQLKGDMAKPTNYSG